MAYRNSHYITLFNILSITLINIVNSSYNRIESDKNDW